MAANVIGTRQVMDADQAINYPFVISGFLVDQLLSKVFEVFFGLEDGIIAQSLICNQALPGSIPSIPERKKLFMLLKLNNGVA